MYEDRPTWAARAGNCTAHLFLAYPQEETGTWKMKNQDENHKGMLGTGWEERFYCLKKSRGGGDSWGILVWRSPRKSEKDRLIEIERER